MTDSGYSERAEDIKNLIIGGCHFGGKKVTKQMKRYVYKCRADGVYLFDVQKIYEKIQVAARMIASIPEEDTVIAISGRPVGQRAVYKFGQYTHCQAIAGRWTPGMLTNQITKTFQEPRLLIACDPRIDWNALVETSYVNVPVIAVCNTDNALTFVDCAIPANNRSRRSVAMIYYLLTKAVLKLKGEYKEEDFPLPGAFLYRDDKKMEEKKEENYEEQGGEEQVEEQDEGEENFVEES